MSEPKRELISINDAVRAGIVRLRKPVWVNKMDHIKIDIVEGALGPWVHLYAPFNLRCNGRDPVNLLTVLHSASSFDNREYEVYEGPLPESEEYRAEVKRYDPQFTTLEGYYG